MRVLLACPCRFRIRSLPLHHSGVLTLCLSSCPHYVMYTVFALCVLPCPLAASLPAMLSDGGVPYVTYLLYALSSFSLSAIALPTSAWHGLPIGMCRIVSRWLSDSRLAVLLSGITLRLPLAALLAAILSVIHAVPPSACCPIVCLLLDALMANCTRSRSPYSAVCLVVCPLYALICIACGNCALRAAA